MLLEPVAGQILGILLGLDHIPGTLTFVGAAVTLFGLYKVGLSESEITNVEDSHFIDVSR
jgi:hypothetical protein